MKYRLQGTLFWLAYQLSQTRLWELPLSLGLGVAGWLLLGWGWLAGWSGLLLGLLALLLLSSHLLLWRARRREFTAFVADEMAFPNAPARLSDNEHLALRVNGRFSLVDRDTFVWQRPADYWQVPLGDHIIMVAEKPGQYLYQFLEPDNLQQIKPGWVWAWQGAQPALAITFRPNWGPQAPLPPLSQFQFGDAETPTPGPPRTIYLLFDTPAERQQVWRQLSATVVGER
ncbi:MAG: hypothetical protein R6X32_01700 [Chloroflexota bacterium]